MERKIPVIRAGLIGTAIVSGTLWMVWLLNINTTTKYQVLMGALDMVWIRRILGAVCLLSIGGIAATFPLKQKRHYGIIFAILAGIYVIGLVLFSAPAPEMKTYIFNSSGHQLIVREEVHGLRHQALFYERKNAAIIEYLGNMDYYDKESAFANGNYSVSWKEDGRVSVSILANFDAGSGQEAVAREESYVETRETKEQTFYFR
ncbi:MAG TPA: hypothetical protein IAB46_11890 [Candidatus Scybalocola faecigallinarum]|uniref:Uncharacterized protein n=1 Tax=Candidatus Scybalocola faecigallinarum TaxID=2840941 RepID=A0A9D1F6M3_9FIRM|nr:hypothetical protein [Candidatus Scybalocola faecigallinarum]